MKHASEFFNLSKMKQKKILKKVVKQANDDQKKTMQKAQKLCKVRKPYVQTQYRHKAKGPWEIVVKARRELELGYEKPIEENRKPKVSKSPRRTKQR